MFTLFGRLLIATVGRQIPSCTCFLMEILNLEKISGYLLQNVLKVVTSLSYICQYIQGTVNDIENFVQWSRVKMDGNVAMRIGSQKQVSEDKTIDLYK